MKKIAIIGSPGAGKTTSAIALGSKLDIQVFHLDRLFWESGWVEKPKHERENILERLTYEKSWIIEGTYLDTSASRLYEADTIVFLDMPFHICLWRATKRRFLYRNKLRPDLPKGCKERLSWYYILKVLGFPLRGRRRLLKQLPKIPSENVVLMLQSNKQVKRFLENPEKYAHEKRILYAEEKKTVFKPFLGHNNSISTKVHLPELSSRSFIKATLGLIIIYIAAMLTLFR